MAKKTSRTREARQRRQQQRRRNQRVLLLAAIVVIAAVGIAVVIVSNQPVEAHIPEDLSERYQDIQRSYSRDGYPRLGDTDAPVTVEEYASFACPGCEAFHRESFDAVLDRVKAAQVLYTYVPLQTGSVPNAPGASRAALCAGQQGMFWEMHDILFDWQTRYGNTAFSQNRLLAGVEQLSLSGDAFTSCFNSAAISATLNAALNEEVSTTPTIRVNGVTVDGDGTIPTAAIILAAIDDAAPDDWGLVESDLAPEPEEAEEAVEETVDIQAENDDEAADAGALTEAAALDSGDEQDESAPQTDADPAPVETVTPPAAPDEEADA